MDYNSENHEILQGRHLDQMLSQVHTLLIQLIQQVTAVNTSLAEEKIKQIHTQSQINELKTTLSSIDDKLQALQIDNAKTSVKFGLITFVGTFIFVTVFHWFITDAEGAHMQALPPPKYELSKPKEEWETYDNGQ